MDITERTPLIHSNSPPTINLRYIPRTWSKLMIITSIIDFIVHLIIYILSYLDKTKNNLTIVNNYLIPLKFYDYLIISSIRVSLLFGFCYVKELIKIHIPIIITLVSYLFPFFFFF
ncbi:hypothetical protein BCR36DRAFT_357290 [Piromyces finnis]|uniref:Uncharacterized protein n=1 Tax=Piromyces finnis TaxID=1754191 RepID=A0A1Y1V395_9FUNG|nr:hypothetical protein BCR36DRAFT_357290 [Piromyces finnis]|eukprot:ORX46179.1 hypothetical protein BCR36DRAFT_357290 [Piromyces finnis]